MPGIYAQTVVKFESVSEARNAYATTPRSPNIVMVIKYTILQERSQAILEFLVHGCSHLLGQAIDAAWSFINYLYFYTILGICGERRVQL